MTRKSWLKDGIIEALINNSDFYEAVRQKNSARAINLAAEIITNEFYTGGFTIIRHRTPNMINRARIARKKNHD